MEKRTVKVTREHTEEAKRMLRLMGVPVVEVGLADALHDERNTSKAPGEAEAQCAALCKAGKVGNRSSFAHIYSL